MPDTTPSTCPVCKMAEHKLSCPERADGQMKISTNLPPRAPSMPPLPAFSHFLEAGTTEMEKDAIRAYAKAYAQSVADARVREAIGIVYAAMFAVKGDKATLFDAQTAIRDLGRSLAGKEGTK